MLRGLSRAICTLLLLSGQLLAARAAPPDDGAAVAAEAIATALTLPEGYKRDVVLRTVSRNLRWFGQKEAGVKAARAMSDGGVEELPPGTRPSPPRYVLLVEAQPSQDPCDAGIWREEGSGEAKTPRER